MAEAGFPIWAGLPYSETVARALSLLKEHGRTDLAPTLGLVLAAAVTDARRACLARLPPGTELVLAVAPSSRAAYRTRGYNPVDVLVRRARLELPIIRPLRVARRVRDQAGLGVAARQQNLAGSLAVRTRFPEGSLQGATVLLVDDVVTTGATLLECRRALESAGAHVVGAATVAFAERRHGRSAVLRSTEFVTE
ncbi:ComF family protein [Subtercola endophyticus]|uniref:ComF family protein n=1 Tax=Subtercola endophyticus TaxID=2895559 RepID=UPI001E5B321C|nr:phosphoribosyltransferase family protein [Subtercola endophyticus]UFS57714.1 ComF family protein [Subtercola endophyticus]